MAGAIPSRRRLLAVAAALGIAGWSVASAAQAAAAAPDPVTVQAPIAALDQALIGLMKAGQTTPFPQRFATLTPVVEAAFDLPAVLQSTVGLAWAGLPQDQRDKLLTAFRRFTVASYVANFDNYDGERFEIAPALRPVGAEQVVQTRLVPSNGTPTRLDYVMRDTPAGWRAVDVLLDGSISRAAVQRSDFRSLLSNGSADRLIASLDQKVDQLSAGTLH